MNIYIYDVEVFKEDWLVVFRSVEEGSDHVVIHNNNHQLREFLQTPDLMLGGFNNKFYDDAIIHAIWHGADNLIVKQLNDHIIEGKMWWEFPFLNYKKKQFQSFDLRDDLQMGLSLKAIEGHLGQSIVESDVDFRLDRKLTDDELEETIEYCKTDVDNTFLLYKTRSNYIDSKKTVARIKGMDEAEAITLTNAKLTARFLDAKKTMYMDEMEYTPPKELQLGKYEHVLKFFMDPVKYTLYELRKELETETRKTRIGVINRRIAKIEKGNRYDCKLESDISDVPHTYAWGGIHGAIPNYVQYEQEGYKMVTIDVGSYYPSMMIEYNYISRSVPDAKGFADIYHTRMKAKQEGDKETSNALKLILNTCYGAMKNQYNDLYDARNASAICITGQLLLTDLIDKLEVVEGFELIQSNTDGLMIRYPEVHDNQVVAIVTEWEQRTRMNMEYTDIHAIAQKDVNNYVMSSGEVYYYEDGVKVVAEEDRNKLELKGGYVSLAKGGHFENNSLVIVHKALVEYFINQTPVEDTIIACDNVEEFQVIAKTGSTYDGTYHQVGEIQVPVQKVNRVYATTNKNYGTIYKTKKNGNADKIANLPDHCIIDNEGVMTIDDIDREFYIEMAKKRVSDYVGSKKVSQPKKAPKKAATKPKKKTGGTTMTKKLNIYQKISKVRQEFIKAKPKKTGINRFAEYKYFELADIVPIAMSLCDKYDLIPLVDFDEDFAYMRVVDSESMREGVSTNPFAEEHQTSTSDMIADTVVFRSPMRKLTVKGMNEIQALGGVETYQRRYLYMMFLDIVEADAFDATNGKDDAEEPVKKAPATTKKKAAAKKTEEKVEEKEAPVKKAASKEPATAADRKNKAKEITDADGGMSPAQEKAIKTGLKKLRDSEADEEVKKHEKFIRAAMTKLREGLTKKQAENLLIKVGERVA